MDAGVPLHEALNQQRGAGVRFVPADELPVGTAYEQYIFETGRCPTREGAHDFFNGLVWLGMPQTKRQMNRVQAARIAADGVGARRGPVRDTVTLLDENGALLCAPPPLWDALERRQWRRLFVELRPLWEEARLLVFGHALLEKLLAPRKNLTAHVWASPAPAGTLDQLDRWLAGEVTEARLAAKPFLPLPVLGVPGWWPGNVNFSFYDDSLIFRPAARQEPITTKPSATPAP